MPVAPFAPLIGAGIGGLFGGMSKPKSVDQGVYGMSGGNRQQLGSDAYNQIHGIYQNDPNQFWGGENAWTTSKGIGPHGGGPITWEDLVGGGGGGAGHASAGHASVALGINDPTYAMDIPKEQEERLQSRLNEIGSAQETDSWRQMQDEMTRGGTASDSPAAIAAQASLQRQRLKGGAEAVRDTRSQWTEHARDLRNAWNQIATGVSEANASNDTQASIANAGYRTQANLAGAGRSAAAAQFLVGSRGADESRAIERYNTLNNMNQTWQHPVNQKTQQQSTFGRIMQGVSGGMSMGSAIGGMFGGGGGSGGGGGQMGNDYGAYPSGGNSYGMGTDWNQGGYGGQYSNYVGSPGNQGGYAGGY